MRKVAVITGSRSEYGLLYPVIKAIDEHSGLKLSLIVSGTHLSKKFGYTVNDIMKDGFKPAALVPMYVGKDSGADIARSVSKAIEGFIRAYSKVKPDIILILGDRGESFAAAITAAYMGIPIGHIFGGDQCKGGDLDDSIRHAITKLSHVHFAAAKQHAERLKGLGEEAWRVHTVGSPALDSILNKSLLEKKELAQKYDLDFSNPVILMLQHAVGVESDQAGKHVKETMEALKQVGEQVVVVQPPVDTGTYRLIEVLDSYRNDPIFRIKKSVPHLDYLSLMKHAEVMVGNSSSGIMEAPSFNLPVVNIGLRQQGRLRSTNIIDVGYDRKIIAKAIKKALYDDKWRSKVRKCRNPYGDGKTAGRIVEIIRKLKPGASLMQKGMTY
ncbi:MAG: UDP-N-acetylglucosamine 2-epimerase (hydrolyzing) [Candidatus Margulisbacteria bacterium]|nr:UDP-N-acetylglucosamine 2-epimerase (hydrolyzing) [Candidatus Margulisiibacteriota bacterium]